jgi:putative membrane protein
VLLSHRSSVFGSAAHLWRGTALKSVWHLVVLVGLTSLGVDALYDRFDLTDHFSLSLAPFSLIGLALSIFLGFRNNACYDRYWEGRKHWGTLVNGSRTFARTVHLYVGGDDALKRELVYRQIAFVHALRMHLRAESDWSKQLGKYLPADEIDDFKAEHNVPQAIARRLGERLRDTWRSGAVDVFHLPHLEAGVAMDTDVQGACERIKNTPLPASYTILTHRIVGLYCLLLPFGLHKDVGHLTPIVTMFVSYAFLGLDSIGSEIEDPFGKDVNDLPLTQISTSIERDLRRALGETELPDPVLPVNGVVT